MACLPPLGGAGRLWYCFQLAVRVGVIGGGRAGYANGCAQSEEIPGTIDVGTHAVLVNLTNKADLNGELVYASEGGSLRQSYSLS